MPIAMGYYLAAQAAGMLVDAYGNSQSAAASQKGTDKQIAAIEENIALNRLQTEDASLQALRALRQNLGTQAAMMAARGIRSGQGTSALLSNESVAAFSSDERMRRINSMVNEKNLRAQESITEMNQKAYENKQWTDFGKSVFDKIPTNPSAWKAFGDSWGSASNSLNKVRPS